MGDLGDRQTYVRWWLVAALAVCCVVTLLTSADAPATAARASSKHDTLVWHDEFSGKAGRAPSPKRWRHEVGGAGWGNRELECYTDDPRNAATNGKGQLVITARKETTACAGGTVNAYSSARLTTQYRYTATYGRFEMRARMPSGVGTWPAFWALGADIGKVGWPRTGEVDVVEYLPRAPLETFGTVHGPTVAGGHYYLSRKVAAPVDLSKAFHRYAMDWSPSQIVFYVDDQRIGTVYRSTLEKKGLWVADHPYYLLLNLAVGGALGGQVPDTTTWPQHYAIDWVRVWK